MIGLRTAGDQELVRFARKGSRGAFDRLMVRYQEKMYRLARKLSDTQEDAEDIVQDAFAKAYTAMPGFRGESKFSTWLYRITLNMAIMRRRRKRFQHLSLDSPIETRDGHMQRDIEDTSSGPLDRLIRGESRQILAEAVSHLPPEAKSVFVLRHFEGLSTEETAGILKISAAAVKSRLHRTMAMLRENVLDYTRKQPAGDCAAGFAA
jgi:RNA polymerase sigma-70 factor (ECF subfamily)